MGTVLLIGKSIVPENVFTFNEGGYIKIDIPGIGVLSNPVKKQHVESNPIAAFGFDTLMFGRDWPVCNGVDSYEQA